jgi:hypothetical protein
MRHSPADRTRCHHPNGCHPTTPPTLRYEGEFKKLGKKHPVAVWFWQIVSRYEQEDMARLLQFTTGTSRVPAQGFRTLQSNDGYAKMFTLRSVHTAVSMYPRAHTCFNRIDLPLYASKADMETFLSVVINMEVTGFTIE